MPNDDQDKPENISITFKVPRATHDAIKQVLARDRKYRGTIAYFCEDAVLRELEASGLKLSPPASF